MSMDTMYKARLHQLLSYGHANWQADMHAGMIDLYIYKME